MDGSSVNSSSTDSVYFWSECDPYDDDNHDDGAGKLEGPSAGLLILIITNSFEFLVGAPLNLWLICHIFRQRSKVGGVLPADFFPVHLAITQLTFYLGLPIFISNHLLWQSDNVLAVVTFLTSIVLIMKPLLLCLVCVERYMAVVQPINYLRFKAHQYKWGCLGVSWCIFIILASSCAVERSVIILCVVLIPVLVIDTFCSLSILKTLKKPPPGDRVVMEQKKKKQNKGEEERKTHKNRSQEMRIEEREQSRRTDGRKEEKMKEVGRSESRSAGEMNSMKKKAFVTIVIIQTVLTLNYLPIIITWPMNALVPAHAIKCQYLPMSIASAASCTYLQPLLYLHRLGRLPCMTSQNT